LGDWQWRFGMSADSDP